MRRIWTGISITCLCVLIGLGLLQSWGQGVTIGSIQGTVTDSSGALVSGAVVTITNNGTNATQTITTGANGSFLAQNLPIGVYDVKTERAGFSTAIRHNVEVTVNQAVVFNIQLLVGNA